MFHISLVSCQSYSNRPVMIAFLVQDFFTGGSGTMSKTLSYAVLFMAKHVDIQRKIQEEVDEVLAGNHVAK